MWDCPAAESTRLGIEFDPCLEDGESGERFEDDEQHGFVSEVVVLFCICRVSVMGHRMSNPKGSIWKDFSKIIECGIVWN